jgi:hypothetical protein
MPVASPELFPCRRDAGSHGVELRFPAPASGQQKSMRRNTPRRASEPAFHSRHSRSTQEH